MPLDTTTPNSAGWWLARLLKKLDAQKTRADLLETYFEGCNGIPISADKAVRQSYRRLMSMARTNFAELVVEATRERMSPAGFRTGAEGDENGDSEAWRIWQANSLDADSALVHRAELALADGYVMVGPVDPEIGAPVITPEDPREVVTEHDPARKRKTVAALKVFRQDDSDHAYLYLPGVVVRFSRKADLAQMGLAVDPESWEPESLQTFPQQVVPVVRFANRAKINGASLGEFEPHLSILDRINYSILNRLEIATLQAFRQRALKGGPDKDENGNEIDYDDIFAADPGAMWHLDATQDLWESGVVELTPMLAGLRHDIQDLAAVTRTPLFYLTPDSANGSAEGASLAREGLVFKTKDRIRQTSESWERVMALAFLFAGDAQRAALGDMEVIWDAPERFSLAERYDAATKAQAAGVPWHTTMEQVLQFSPQEIERMATERAADALLNAPLPGEVAVAP